MEKRVRRRGRLYSRPTRRATSRIDKTPWPVIALRICQRFLVRVFQSRSTELNEMCAISISPGTRRHRRLLLREAIARVTLVIPAPLIDVAQNRRADPPGESEPFELADMPVIALSSLVVVTQHAFTAERHRPAHI